MLFSALWDSAPDPGTELIPSGTLEPITASWEPGPVEEESRARLRRLVPFRRSRGISGD